MTREQKDEAIRTLVACKHSGFTPDDAAMLEQATDTRIESFLVAAEARKAEVEKAKADPKVLTEEEFMKIAPPSLKALIAKQQKQDTDRKAELVAALKIAQDEFAEAELASLPLESLERMARVAKIDEKPASYEGRGVPRALAQKDDVYAHPPDPYVEGLKRLSAEQKAN